MISVPDSFLEILSSHLEGLKQSGIREVAWHGPLPSERKTPPVEPPAPPRPPSPPPLEKARTEAALPRTRSPETISVPAGPSPAWAVARRHPECRDEGWRDEDRILIVSDLDEFQGEAGTLLNEMLNAIGFVTEGAPTAFSTSAPEACTRVLVFGHPGLQALVTAEVNLQLVRGRWRKSAYGRMTATYAPSSVLDSPSGKKTVWGDLRNLLTDLGLAIPEWTRKKLGGQG
jgi:hypothetical protein